MIKVGDKVKVKLHEPVGNPTTDSANSYLSQWVGQVGEVYEKSSSHTWHVKWIAETGSVRFSGTFYDDELEVVE